MESETYRGFNVWGHAIWQQGELHQPERYAASGTITQGNKVIEASGVLGLFETDEEAQQAGLGWARAWIDSLG
jgi:hypothetical protein